METSITDRLTQYSKGTAPTIIWVLTQHIVLVILALCEQCKRVVLCGDVNQTQ